MKKMLRLTFIFIISTLFLSSCSSVEDEDTISSSTMSRFRENEIMEYQGARLDPAVGPRDNSISGVQEVDIETYQLNITGLVDQSVTLTYEEVLALDKYQRLITLYCVEGWDATIFWEGAFISDIMNLAGVKAEANTVIFKAVDGYTTSLPLDQIVDNQLILAYNANEIPLPPEMGYPFIVVAEDKLGYKWARWVNEIELSDDADYQGYWEQRGFSNEAEINR